MKSFRELDAWSVSFELAKRIYEVTQEMPKTELYGLTSQMRRAAVSVPANIAEGYGRNNRGEYIQFLGISHGSLLELDTLYQLSVELGYLQCSEEILGLIKRSGQLIQRLNASLRS